MDLLQVKGFNQNIMTMVFRHKDLRNTETVSKADFIHIVKELDTENYLGDAVIRDQADLLDPSNQGQIRYLEFFNRVEFEFEKRGVINYIFLSIKSQMDFAQRGSTLQDLFLNLKVPMAAQIDSKLME